MSRCRTQREETGAAVLEFVFIMPALLLFACAVLDTAAYIKAGITADTAATAGVRYLMDSASSAEEISERDVVSYLGRVDKAFATGQAQVSISAGDTVTETYTHRFYINNSARETQLNRTSSKVTTQPIAVTVACQGFCITPVGKLLFAGTDGSGFVCATQCGEIDLTDGATW